MTLSNTMARTVDDYTEATPAIASAEVVFTVITGDDALLWSNTEANRSAWDRLWAECPWSTAFQTRAFFDIWVRSYRDAWSPLLVTGRRRDGSLVGVMPLGENASLIVGAGAHQAEYQGPISTEADALAFFTGAVQALAKHAPHRELRLRYLPPNMPPTIIEWLQQHRRAILVPRETQYLVVDGGTAAAAMKKSANKSKLNRLRRAGEVQFRRLTPDQIEADFPRIVAMYDFRQGALHDVCPFADDNRKLAFHLDWLRSAPGQLHATGLYVDNQLISAVLLVRSKEVAHLAISAHSPDHAAYSPSKLNLYFAAGSLFEEGASVLDLTPGDDPWKARFATEVRTVWDVSVFASPWPVRSLRLRAAAKRLARGALTRAGLSVDDLKSWVQRPGDTWRAKRKSNARPQAQFMFDVSETLSSYPSGQSVPANCLPDLLVLSERLRRGGRGAFLSDALERIERGDRCFVTFDPARGTHCLGWLRVQEKADVAVFDGFWLSDPKHLDTAVSCLSAMVRAVGDGPRTVLMNLQRDQQILRLVVRFLRSPSAAT